MAHKSDILEFDLKAIREQFPILHQKINGHPLVYLDNAATTQKPLEVIEAISDYYKGYNANIHRGIHTLAEKATAAFEDTREIVQKFINAGEKEEIIFTTGTTNGINLVASSYGGAFLEEGDEVLVSTLEHHSNTVPWQMVCDRKKAHLKVIPINEYGDIIWEEFLKALNPKTKIVSIVHASNSLGTINPIKDIVREAHKVGAVVMVDAAQATAHLELDVQDLDVDFYAFSGHKIFGPTGTGALYGKRALLEKMPPYMGGGEMIKEVTFEKTTYNDIPYKFEAGTPNIADVIGMGVALNFVNRIGKEAIRAHEDKLLAYAHEQLEAIEGVTIIGKAENKVSVVSFIVEGIHHFDVGQLLDARGIAVRTGHHCTQPLMDRYGIEGTIRASFSFYNTLEEIDRLVEGLKRISKMLK